MFQPSTTEIGSQDARPDRETVIKFVISGPFLNAEAAHTRWSTEQAPALDDLLGRIADLERKLDEERALVDLLSSRIPAAPAREPAPSPADLRPPVEPAHLRAVEAVVEPAATIAPPAPLPLSTAVRTPPPKVRGLRRMIGALRHL